MKIEQMRRVRDPRRCGCVPGWRLIDVRLGRLLFRMRGDAKNPMVAEPILIAGHPAATPLFEFLEGRLPRA